jgi:cell division protease FtsH
MNKDLKEENNQEKPDFRQALLGRQGCSSSIIWIALLLLLIPWLYRMFADDADLKDEIAYTTFRAQVKAGNVEEVVVTEQEIEGRFNDPVEERLDTGESVSVTEFITYLPSFPDADLYSLLEENDVIVRTKPPRGESGWMILLNFLPLIFILAVGFFIYRRFAAQGQGMMAMTQSKARQFDTSMEVTTFEDVAGADGAKTELQEIIEFLMNPERFQLLGARIPKGVLLIGPPGTGKTLLARAVAGEAKAPFFSITGSDFMEMFVGVGASRVRDLFKQAKQHAPAIIFIDELDSIGRKRGAGLGGGHDEREQTLNQLLSELDGFEPTENIIVMAATNRPDILDPALQRPGRFDRQVMVDLPTMKDRLEILKIHAKGKPIAENVDLEQIARGTPGFSGADLANLLNEAALLAAREDKKQISDEEVSKARDKVIMGLESNLVLTREDKQLLAYHEAGHAVVGALLPHTDPVYKVTIVPRGRAMGVTQQIPENDRYLYTKDYMLDQMSVLMAGRAAEELVMETTTSGAANDLKQATYLARKMVLEWGMSENLGRVSLSDESQEIFLGDEIARSRNFSERTAREVDQEIRSILDEAYLRARKILKENKEGLDRVVEELVEKEEISGVELKNILDLEKQTETSTLTE